MSRRLLLVAPLALALFSAACGGGGTTPPPPPLMGNFTLASLKGNFAFSMSGQDPNTGGTIQRTGSFVADGQGNVTAAMEDIAGEQSPVTFTGGSSYTIQSNGRGTITLNTALQPLKLSFAMTVAASSIGNAGSGLLIQTDLFGASSGSFTQQDVTTFGVPFNLGNHVFDFSGIDTSGAPASLVGEFTSDGTGNVTNGLLDVNDAGNLSTNAIQPGGTFQLDANANGTTFGRGTISVGGIGFVFYLVDSTHAKFIEEDGVAFTQGEVVQQSASIPGTTAAWPAGNLAYLVAGGTGLGPLGNASSFQTDGSGNLTNISSFDNNNGTATSTTSANGTYSIDNTHAGTGRATFSITVNGQSQTFTAVFYLISPTQAVFQDTSVGAVADGSLASQSAPGGTNFAFNLSGQDLDHGFEEDYVGQFSTSSSSGANGAADWVQLATTGSQPLFTNVPITVTASFPANGNPNSKS